MEATESGDRNNMPKEQEDPLNFKNGNPGSVIYGNFINYYKFHPPDKRITLLDRDVWKILQAGKDICVLDVGCNAGDLTESLHDFLSVKVGIAQCNILGIDIDPVLIKRANEKNSDPDKIEFKCVNIMKSEDWNAMCTNYLQKFGKAKFSVTFCFSVTMWIHLNHGDEGLKRFLRLVSSISEILVIEPQPWKCYKTARKRLKLADEDFPEFSNLKINTNVEDQIEAFLEKECYCVKIEETGRTKWGRKLLFFKRLE